MTKGRLLAVFGSGLLVALIIMININSRRDRDSGAFACEDASIKSVMANIVVKAGKAASGSEISNVISTRDGNNITCTGILDGKSVTYRITFVPEDQRDTVPNRDGMLPESVEYDGWRHDRPKN